jgi:hypothetical protein
MRAAVYTRYGPPRVAHTWKPLYARPAARRASQVDPTTILRQE